MITSSMPTAPLQSPGLRLDSGDAAVTDLCQQRGASYAKLFAWKQSHPQRGSSQGPQMRALTDDVRRLVNVAADLRRGELRFAGFPVRTIEPVRRRVTVERQRVALKSA